MREPPIPMLEAYASWTVLGIEVVAAAIITYGVLEATAAVVLRLVHAQEEQAFGPEMHIRLGRWLSLALLFEVAADILGTAFAPTWEELGKLGATIALRTLLTTFLEREVEAAEASRRRNPPPAAPLRPGETPASEH